MFQYTSYKKNLHNKNRPKVYFFKYTNFLYKPMYQSFVQQVNANSW